jgi:hypothetical protein
MTELYARNLVDDSLRGSRTTAERRDMLQQFLEAPSLPSWPSEVLFDAELYCSGQPWCAQFNDNVYAVHTDNRFLFLGIPSSIRSVAARKWEVIANASLPVDIVNFGFAPSENVLIWVDKAGFVLSSTKYRFT